MSSSITIKDFVGIRQRYPLSGRYAAAEVRDEYRWLRARGLNRNDARGAVRRILKCAVRPTSINRPTLVAGRCSRGYDDACTPSYCPCMA